MIRQLASGAVVLTALLFILTVVTSWTGGRYLLRHALRFPPRRPAAKLFWLSVAYLFLGPAFGFWSFARAIGRNIGYLP